MKVLKIDHLGVAVKSIDHGKNFWTDVLGLEFEGTETVAEQKVTTAFFPVGESEVELLESTAPDGPIAKYQEKKGEGIQHIGFMVDDIEAETAKLAKEGYKVTQSAETPTVIWAYYGTDEVGGFSIELMQKK